jgi:hypothetical protein
MTNIPKQKFKAGAIVATVWGNETLKDNEVVNYNTISLDRIYKDKAGEWKNTNSFRVSDLPKVALVMNKAYEFLTLNANQAEA